MVRTKSKGPGPKKTRVSKKKKQHVLRHTVQHMRGGGDYPQSHQRVRKIDPRVAGAGVLGSRIKDRVHHGHTIPRVGKPISTQTDRPGTRTMSTMFRANTSKLKYNSKDTQTDARTDARKAKLSNSSATAYNLNYPKERKDAGTQFKPAGVSVGSQVRNEGPRFPNMGERPFYNPNPHKEEAMPDMADRMQLDGMHKPKRKGMGPKNMEIERPGRVKKEVARIDASYNPGNELVGAEQVLRNDLGKGKAPRKAEAPKPAPKHEKPPEFNRNNFDDGKNAGKRKENKKKEEERRNIREDFRNPGGQGKPKKAPVVPATEEQERKHDQANIDATVANNKKTGELRKELAQRNRERKAAREAAKGDKLAEKRGGVPSGSANIPANQHESSGSGSGHHHHHTGERHMHDDHFRTGL